MLRIINIILVILIGLSIAFFTNDTQDSKKQEVVEIIRETPEIDMMK